MTDAHHEVSDDESVDEIYGKVLCIDQVGILTFLITLLPISDKFLYHTR